MIGPMPSGLDVIAYWDSTNDSVNWARPNENQTGHGLSGPIMKYEKSKILSC